MPPTATTAAPTISGDKKTLGSGQTTILHGSEGIHHNPYEEALVTAALLHLPRLLGKLSFQRLALPVANSGRLLVILPLLPLADDAFLFHHALEPLDGFLEVFSLIYPNMSD